MSFAVAGRTAGGVAAVLLGLKSRRFWFAVAALDFAGVANVLRATTPEEQRRAALVNASIDALMGAAALAMARRRRGGQKLAAGVVSAGLWFGAGAWISAAAAAGSAAAPATA